MPYESEAINLQTDDMWGGGKISQFQAAMWGVLQHKGATYQIGSREEAHIRWIDRSLSNSHAPESPPFRPTPRQRQIRFETNCPLASETTNPLAPPPGAGRVDRSGTLSAPLLVEAEAEAEAKTSETANPLAPPGAGRVDRSGTLSGTARRMAVHRAAPAAPAFIRVGTFRAGLPAVAVDRRVLDGDPSHTWTDNPVVRIAPRMRMGSFRAETPTVYADESALFHEMPESEWIDNPTHGGR